MKKSYFVFILFLFSQTMICLAQDTLVPIPSKHVRRSKAQIGIFFSPDYCNQKYKGVAYPNSGSLNKYNQSIADTLNAITNSSVGYSTGADVVCHFTKRIALKTGIYFSMRVKRYDAFLYSNGFYAGYGVFHLPAYEKEKISFLEIPFAFNYTFYPASTSKLHLNCFGGALFSLNCEKNKFETIKRWDATQPLPTTEQDFSSGNRMPFSFLYIGAVAGLKADYMIGDHFAVSVSPMFKYFPLMFWNLAKGGGQSETIELPYSIGCAFGATYYF